MGALWALLGPKKEPKTPVSGMGARIVNMFRMHYRGLVGTIVPLVVLPNFLVYGDSTKTVLVMWLYMFWVMFWQPVSPAPAGLIPIWMLPVLGAISSDNTCACYMSEGTCLFILANMNLLLWNNSGLDRRIALWFLCSGDTSQFSAKKLVYKCCCAGFFLSIFSNKLIVANIMIQYMTSILTSLQSSAVKGADANFKEVRYIVNNAIQTSCSIGGIVIVHSSYATLAFRTIFLRTCRKKDHMWYDIFNYLEYTSFALPTAIVMIIVNCAYHMVLIGSKSEKPMSAASMNKVRTTLLNHQKELPHGLTLHEKITLFCSILILIAHFTRWNKFLGGWAKAFGVYNGVPSVKDATVSAVFVVLLHSLPSGFRFFKVWGAQKKSEVGVPKPASAILWWRFVDKNITYGYIFLIGSGVALSYAALHSKLSQEIATGQIGKMFNEKSMVVYLLMICVVGVFLSNIMTSVAAIVVFLPFVMNLYAEVPQPEAGRIGDFGEGAIVREGDEEGGGSTGPAYEIDRIYLGSLAAGIAGSLGFMFPFIYTPAYFNYYTGKVPKKKSAPYGAIASILCMIVLWLSISFFAPLIWDPNAIHQVASPTEKPKPTTAAPDL